MVRVTGIALLSIVAAACGSGSSPTTPSPPPSGFPASTSMLLTNCDPAGQEVACTALLMNSSSTGLAIEEVTASAQWFVTPGDVMQMPSPGRFRPTRNGEVSIDARSSTGARTLLPARFAVSPGLPARRLGALMVLVRDSTAPIVGAMVEVLDGYRAGATCVTASIGTCTVDPVVTSETFSLRVIKTGYQSGTVTFRGSPDGFLPPAVLVTLTPQ